MKSAHSKKKALEQLGLLWQQGRFAEAADSLRALLEDYPKDAVLWRDLGSVLLQLKDYEGALTATIKAMEQRQYDPVCLLNRANALTMSGKPAEALEFYAAAARYEPNNFFTRFFYAGALSFLGKAEESLPHYKAALTLQPDNIEAQWNYSDTLLRMGRFKEGWAGFETRWKRNVLQEKVYPCPRWKGEDLTGKTILVYEEQGFGDTIFATRFLPLVKKRGARVLFLCRPDLQRIFKDLPVDRLLTQDDPAEKLDYYIPVMSLPGILGIELNSIPAPLPLHVPALSNELQRLINKDSFKVGIVWSGNPKFQQNNLRAVSLEKFLPLTEIPSVQLYSLQKDAAINNPQIIDLAPHLHDFADTAAAIKELDLIIMTDSSVAHLAGTLGKPVWNLLAHHAYWVYLTERSDSPWYPSMRLFRQPAPGDWDSVFKNVTEELKSRTK